jgi:sec-independent protein translocase protein TatA
MFNLGPWELAIVGIVAILLFGQRLPEVMRSLGKSYNEFRKGLSDIQSSINYTDYSSPSNNSYSSSTRTSSDYEDYEEPTAPKFEPPPSLSEAPGSETAASAAVSDDASRAAGTADSSAPSDDIAKPIGEK